jgi:ABC-2 type transport system permease protein
MKAIFIRAFFSHCETACIFARPFLCDALTYGVDLLHGAVHGENTMPFTLDLSILAAFCIGLFAASLWNIERKWIV